MAPFDVSVKEADVHAGRLRVVLQVAGAVMQSHLTERSSGYHAKIAVRVLRAALVPIAERSVHTKLSQGRLFLRDRL